MKKFFKWLDNYDDFIVNFFKIVLLIIGIIFAANLERGNKKEIIKEAIKESNKTK